MERQEASTAPPSGTPALAETHRIGWGLAALIMLEVAAAAVIGFLTLAGVGIPSFFTPILFFLILRVVGDSAKAFAGATVGGLATEGHTKAAAWAVLAIGLWTSLAGSTPFWTIGAGLALAGFSLWGHHSQVITRSRRLAVEEGVLGALFGALGVAAASTLLGLAPPWSVVVPFSVLAVGLALAARSIVRLAKRGKATRGPEATGFGAWYQEHFFRLTLVIVGILAYVLFVRQAIRGWVPFLFLFEYSAAVFVLGILLWSMRGFLRKRLVESPIRSPRHKHKQEVERQGETSFDEVETAFGRFLELGEPDAVASLAERLKSDGVQVSGALGRIAEYRRRDELLLIHPGWLYAGRLAVVGLILLGALSFGDTLGAPGDYYSTVIPLLVGLGVYTAQWNRYGGPWFVKTALGLAGFVLLLLSPVRLFAGNVIGLGFLALAAGLPVAHFFRARKGRPIPRYSYRGNDPLTAIDRLRTLNEAAAVRRILWTTVFGIIIFFVVGELTRLFEQLAILFTLYVYLALMIVLQPIVLIAGLRLGRSQVQHRHERERLQRKHLLDDALPKLDAAFAATGRHGTPMIGDARRGVPGRNRARAGRT